MVVCIEASLGLFFRINTEPKWQCPVALKHSLHRGFLTRDCFLECGEPLELDDYVVDESLDGRGVVGCLDTTLIPDILRAVQGAKLISPKDKQAIADFLDPTGAHHQLPGSADDGTEQ